MSPRRACQAALVAVAVVASTITTVSATASSVPLRAAKSAPANGATAVPGHWTGVTPTGTPTDPPHPAPVVRVPMSSSPVQWGGASVTIASDAPYGTTRSLIVRYVATVHGVCGLRDSGREPCPLPRKGKLTWQVLGPGETITWAYRTAPLAKCETTITTQHPAGGCAVDWRVYGDQQLSATYVASTSTGTVEAQATSAVRIVAPVDLGRRRYRVDGNFSIGDCSMVTAADWVETVTGVTPPPASVIADYWTALAADGDGHHDDGLSVPQLWAWWQAHPIGGVKLSSATSIPVGAVGVQLAAGHPLIAIADLPADFGFDTTGGGWHLWLVVGDSNYGPMIVTWGTEAQLSWAQFNAMTTGVWVITPAPPSSPTTSSTTAPPATTTPAGDAAKRAHPNEGLESPLPLRGGVSAPHDRQGCRQNGQPGELPAGRDRRPMRIAVANLKGGVGKTTAAVYLSQHLSGSGRTLLVDLDPQASCLDWGNAATRAGEPLGAELVALAPQGSDAGSYAALGRRIDSMGAAHDHVVIDTPPGDQLVVAAAMSTADIVVVPTRPTKLEVARVGVTAEVAESVGKPVAVLLTSRAGAKALGLARQALTMHGYPVVPEVIPLREAIASSYGHRPDPRYVRIFGQVTRVLELAIAA